jgi:hypothetical protein
VFLEIELVSRYKEDRDYVHSCGSLSLEEQQLADVEALDLFRVSHICDLMVENFKKVYGVSVTSSEKVKRSLYRECSISSIPYPGCEFFRVYHAKDFEMTSLYYDWDAEFNTTVLEVADPIPRFCGHWHGEYKSWDLITMTSNYLSYVLSLVHSKDPNVSGVLVHCISGWDRTPLFISLLRMSLWADGLIHKSLSAEEMLFFTLAYDWLLFGHHFADRLQKTEDILHFCFNFLIHIAKDVTASAPVRLVRLSNLSCPRLSSLEVLLDLPSFQFLQKSLSISSTIEDLPLGLLNLILSAGKLYLLNSLDLEILAVEDTASFEELNLKKMSLSNLMTFKISSNLCLCQGLQTCFSPWKILTRLIAWSLFLVEKRSCLRSVSCFLSSFVRVVSLDPLRNLVLQLQV